MSYVPEPPPANPDIILQRKRILRAVALRLDQGEIVGEDDDRDVGAVTHARGLIDGQQVVYRLIYEDDGSTKVFRTKASAPAPRGFFLDVRRSGLAAQKEVEQGHARDMTFDDPLFDAAFIVDGAPERHVRELLDIHVRQKLVLAGDVSLSTDGADPTGFRSIGQFVITASEWIADPNRAHAMLQAVARLALKARLIGEDGRQQHDALGSAGYREPANASGNGTSDEAGHGDAREIEMAVARRKKRRQGRKLRALVIVGALIGAVVLSAVFSHFLD